MHGALIGGMQRISIVSLGTVTGGQPMGGYTSRPARTFLPNYQGTWTSMGYQDNDGPIHWNKPPPNWDRTDR